MGRLASWVVEQFYGRLAWAYDPAVWALSGGLWYRWAFTAERFVVDQPVLEVGCGTGCLLAHLARKGLEVIGVDKSPQMAAVARRRLDRAGLRGEQAEVGQEVVLFGRFELLQPVVAAGLLEDVAVNTGLRFGFHGYKCPRAPSVFAAA